MITLRTSDQRRLNQNPHYRTRLTFDPRELADPLANGFESLEILNEHWLSPGDNLPPYPHYHPAEILIYVCQGGLAFEDTLGQTGVIRVGEFSLITVEDGIRHAEMNAIGAHWAHVFEIGIRLNKNLNEPNHSQRRFNVAERTGFLRVVASQNGRGNSLRLKQKIVIYSAFLDPGKHVILELLPGQSGWLHLIKGEAVFCGQVLKSGDGVGVNKEHALSFTAKTSTEIILVSFNKS